MWSGPQQYSPGQPAFEFTPTAQGPHNEFQQMRGPPPGPGPGYELGPHGEAHPGMPYDNMSPMGGGQVDPLLSYVVSTTSELEKLVSQQQGLYERQKIENNQMVGKLNDDKLQLSDALEIASQQLKGRESELLDLQTSLHNAQTNIVRLENITKQLEKDVLSEKQNCKQQQIEDEKRFIKLIQALNDDVSDIPGAEDAINDTVTEINALRKYRNDAEQQFQVHKQALIGADKAIAGLKERVQSGEELVDSLKKQVAELKDKIQEIQSLSDEKDTTMQHLEAEVSKRSKVIQDREHFFKSSKEKLVSLQQQNKDLMTLSGKQRGALGQQREAIDDLETKLKENKDIAKQGKAEIARLLEQLNQMRDEIGREQKESLKKDRELGQQASHMQELQTAFAAEKDARDRETKKLKGQIDRLVVDSEAKDSENTKLVEQLTSGKAANKSLENRLNDSEKSGERLAVDLSKQKAKAEKMGSELKETKELLEKLTNDLDASKHMCELLTKDIANSRQRLADETESRKMLLIENEKVANKLGTVSVDKSGLEKVLRVTSGKLKEAEEEVARLKANGTAMQAQLVKEQGSCSELDYRVTQMQKELDTANTNVKSRETALGERERTIEDLQAAMKKMKAEFEDKESELVNKLNESQQNVADLSKETERQSTANETLGKENRRLEASMALQDATIKTREQRIGILEEQLVERNAKVQNQSDQIKDLSAENSQQKEHIWKIKQNLTDAEEGMRARERSIADVSAQFDKTRSHGQGLKAQMDNLRMEYETIQKSHAALQERLRVSQEQSEELSRDKHNLQSNVDTLERELSDALTAKSVVEKDLETQKDTVGGLRASLQGKQGDTAAMQERIQALQQRLSIARENAAAQIQEGEVKQQQLKLEIKEHAQVSEQLKEHLQTKKEELASTMEQLSAYQTNLQEAKTTMGNMSTHIDQLKKGLVEAAQRGANGEEVLKLKEELRQSLRRCAIAETDAQKARKLAANAENMMSEMTRLYEDNDLLTGRLKQMELDLQDLLGKSSQQIGHNNPKQKIQYHLRLKQELEEMRHECTILLRDKYQLEQCIRYLSYRVKSPQAIPEEVDIGASTGVSSSGSKPQSLAPSYMFSTNIGKKYMKANSRSSLAKRNTPIYQSKDQMQAAIEKAQHNTVETVQNWMDPNKKAPKGEEGAADSSGPSALESPEDVQDEVERRILARIATVCSPAASMGPRANAKSAKTRAMHEEARAQAEQEYGEKRIPSGVRKL